MGTHAVLGSGYMTRRGHERELAQLRGNRLFVLADVEVPLKPLASAQLNGVNEAICNEECGWMRGSAENTELKAHPPGYRRTC